MYDLKTVSLYSLLILGVILLVAPEQIKQLIPENDYTKKLMENNVFVGLVAIASSVYLYSYSQEKELTSTSTVTSSAPETISSTTVTTATSK